MSALGHEWPRPDSDDWRGDAACRTRPDLNWFPGQGERFDEQRQVCAGCPVRIDCLADALAVPGNGDFGIWGGTSERQRKAMRRGDSTYRRAVAECGTRSGYMRHRKDHTAICQPCRAANAAYQRELKDRRRPAPVPPTEETRP